MLVRPGARTSLRVASVVALASASAERCWALAYRSCASRAACSRDWASITARWASAAADASVSAAHPTWPAQPPCARAHVRNRAGSALLLVDPAWKACPAPAALGGVSGAIEFGASLIQLLSWGCVRAGASGRGRTPPRVADASGGFVALGGLSSRTPHARMRSQARRGVSR